ncbi:hypothetical protein Thermus77420_23920 [Thermus thalpophilus]
MLLERSLLPEPALYLSAYFERNRDQYYDLLLRISQKGDWASWIAFFLQGVKTEAKDATQKAQRLIALRQAWREIYQGKGGSVHLLALIDLLFERPVLSASIVRERLGVTHAWAMRLIERLAQEGVLSPLGQARRNRLYGAREILQALEEPSYAEEAH